MFGAKPMMNGVEELFLNVITSPAASANIAEPLITLSAAKTAMGVVLFTEPLTAIAIEAPTPAVTLT